MKYAYYPGCSAHGTAIEYGMSTDAVASALGIELSEIPDWVCCGATSAHTTNEMLAIALPAMDLLAADKMGHDLAVICAACFNRLKTASHEIKEKPEKLAELKDVLKELPSNNIKIKHLIEILVNDFGIAELEKRVKKKLEGLKVACYYGCLLTRPPKIMQFDDAEEPVMMDRLMKAIGAEPVEWQFKTECCGGSFTITKTDIVLKLSNDILAMARDAGAECFATACPLCQPNLDMRQKEIENKYGIKYNMPVFYFTQLIGLAIGARPEELGLNKLIVNPVPLLTKKGLL